MDIDSYNHVAYAALAIWFPIVIAMFALLTPRRAVIGAFVFGYLMLPDLSLHVHTLPDINKVSITCMSVIVGSLIFDGARLFTIRPRLIDLAALTLCFVPIVTSHTNDLGIMDGLATSSTIITRWGLAYWIGRAYFNDWEATRELAMGIVIGGLVYMPLCWWEIRMSPQLHGEVYGLTFNSFRRDSSLFGFRPNVFLADGLTVTMFMGVCTLLAYWAWMTQSPRKLLNIPIIYIFASLFFTTIFCKALGGLVLMLAGMAALTMTRWPKTKLPTLVLIIIPFVYVMMRSNKDWSGENLVESARSISDERAKSLEFRLRNENMLSEKALQQPWFGWGGSGRAQVYDASDAHRRTIIDGLWIEIFGEHGIVGLGSLLVMVLGSAFLLWRRIPTRFWSDPACAAPAALCVVVALYMIDGLFNATFNPVASLAVGAVASMSFVARDLFRGVAAQAQPQRPTTAVITGVSDMPYVYARPGAAR